MVNLYITNKKDSYTFLKHILDKYYNFKLNTDLLLKNIYGKPYIPSFKYNFNISHSENLLVIGISDDVIGVDTELDSNNYQSDDLFLSDIKLWTIYESYTKAIGKGLGIDRNLINIDQNLNCISSVNLPTLYYKSFNIHSNIITICTLNKNMEINIICEDLIEDEKLYIFNKENF